MADSEDARAAAAAHISFCIQNLKTLAEKGGRGSGDRLRATLALLELAGVTTPASTGTSSGPGGSESAPPDSSAGGSGAKKYTLYRVDEAGIRTVHDDLKRQAAGGGDGR